MAETLAERYVSPGMFHPRRSRVRARTVLSGDGHVQLQGVQELPKGFSLHCCWSALVLFRSSLYLSLRVQFSEIHTNAVDAPTLGYPGHRCCLSPIDYRPYLKQLP